VPDARVRPVITDAADCGRFEAHVDNVLAGVLEYVLKRGRLALIHTEVLPDREGRGIGAALVRHALDHARASGLRVIPLCEYVQSYLARHPEDDDIVVGRARGTPAGDRSGDVTATIDHGIDGGGA
jgi:predicted GNAT family acetyltransferase